MVGVTFYIAVATMLFGLGLYCLATKKNMIKLLLGIEVMAAAPNLLFIVFSAAKEPGLIDPLAHVFVVTAIVIDGSLVAVGLALTIAVFRRFKTIDVRELRRLKW